MNIITMLSNNFSAFFIVFYFNKYKNSIASNGILKFRNKHRYNLKF